ncbi:MAG: site-2 protease family protein [Phycisphaerae bacterium]|nr:site-2 protease family protein [Phycisphaerae bacterium]
MLNIERMLPMLPGLIIGLTIHETAHAWMSYKLGDGLAQKRGRISLNPFAHLSLLGTLALFFIGFGWAKPVPINPFNYKHPKRDMLLTSLAGPFSNLLLASLTLGFFHVAPVELFPAYIYQALVGLYLINLILAMLNLLPFPPLDGSQIWLSLIPGIKPTLKAKWQSLSTIVLIVFIWSDGFSRIISPLIGHLLGLLPTV